MELLDPSQVPVVLRRDGRRVEQSIVRKLAPGKYVLKLQALDGARLYGFIAIKLLDRNCSSKIDALESYPARQAR